MSVSEQRKNVVYGVGQPLYDLSPQPISSTRAPTTSDKAEIGAVWTNKTTNAGWVLASIVANSATWTPTTVNIGATIDTGGLTVTAGDVFVTAGSLVVEAGDIDVTGRIECDGFIATDSDITAGRSVFVGGDEGTGVVGQTGLTNVVDTTLGAGAGTALMKTGNPGDSSGWMKIYVANAVRWIPYWTNISP